VASATTRYCTRSSHSDSVTTRPDRFSCRPSTGFALPSWEGGRPKVGGVVPEPNPFGFEPPSRGTRSRCPLRGSLHSLERPLRQQRRLAQHIPRRGLFVLLQFLPCYLAVMPFGDLILRPPSGNSGSAWRVRVEVDPVLGRRNRSVFCRNRDRQYSLRIRAARRLLWS
jgi:hypothetical protein